MVHHAAPTDVCLLAFPDVSASSLTGMYEALDAFSLLSGLDDAVPAASPFRTRIVAPTQAELSSASGLPIAVHERLDAVDRTDLVIVPSVMVRHGEWTVGRYPRVVEWLRHMHERGALLCSACSGVLLIAETGLLDGRDATIHWAYAPTFRRNFPLVTLSLDKVLVATGERQQFVMAGASASWHDLVLYLIARQVGVTAAQAISKFLLLQWHADGQAPYVVFDPPTDHSDAAVLRAQRWVGTSFSASAPVDEMVRQSGLPERSFKRRFTRATGLAPIEYVQRLRIEDAKRRLERTDTPVDDIGWRVGYEDPAFFRRLFKRLTHMTPSAYRRKFQLPPFARGALQSPRRALIEHERTKATPDR